MGDSGSGETTGNKKKMRVPRRRKTDVDGPATTLTPDSPEVSHDDPGRLPLGAPLARSPLTNKPSSPIDLLTAPHRVPAAQTKPDTDRPAGEPGGRRSRAYPPPAAAVAQPRPLRVLDGHDEQIEEDDNAQPSLKPSTANAIGDFAAAMTGPIAAAIYIESLAVFIASALLVLLVRAQGRRSALSEGEISGLSPVVAGLGGFVLSLAVDPAAGTSQALTAGVIALGAGAIAALTVKLLADRFVHVRIAVLGEAATAHDLAWQLSAAGVKRCTVVGYVTRTSERDNLRDLDHISFKVRRLGLLSDLSHIVARNDIDLLVMASDQDRLKVFERAAVCTERYRTKLLSLTAFEEVVFRRVPLEQLNVAWFQHIMHPRFRPAPRAVTRAVDVVFAVIAGLLTLPIWAPTAAFMRVAFGNPVLVRRRRVGERGRSFSVLRFRVARRDVTGGAPDEDVPAVGFGKFLRRTKIEQLPTLWNVLRGEMSLVGPRPARPQRMNELEQQMPFYARRNLVRPGLTGWAQLHAPPAGDAGLSADPEAELSHDLFYLKHQSLMLYAFVLLATAWRGFMGPRAAADH